MTEILDRRVRRRWVPALAGWLALLIGLTDVSCAIAPEWHHRIVSVTGSFPGELTNAAHTATTIAGLLLLLLSHALRRRKRRAWKSVVALLAASLVFHAVTRHVSVPAMVVTGLLLVTLIHFRGEFYAVGDPRTRWRAAYVGCGLASASLLLGVGYIYAHRGDLVSGFGMGTWVQHVALGLFGGTGAVEFATEGRDEQFGLMLGGLGLCTLLVTMYLYLRPAEPAPVLTPEDEIRIRELLAREGARDSLGYFSLRRDKSVVWSPSGKACVTYRVVSGVMLASADPLGDPEAWPGAIRAFLVEAERHAWVPAVMGCSELGAEVWCREAGLTALELGDEAVVDTATFSLEGRAMRNVRQMVNRVGRQGYRATLRRESSFDREELAGLWERAEAWRGSGTERGFSMALGRVGDPTDGECAIATATTADGETHAMLHFVPWGPDGLSLDLMRRDSAAQPGLNDFLIAEALRAAPSLGVKKISLNFAVFRSALARGERIGAGPVLRAWRGLLIFLSRWFQIESLYRFNEKFNPVWEPRFFVYPGLQDAPRILLAAMEAEAFIVWPKLRLHGPSGVSTGAGESISIKA